MPKPVIVFDAYGTLFDLGGATRAVAADDARLASVWPRLAEDWRRRQLDYTWLRTIMGAHADFAEVTETALDWALDAAGLGEDGALRTRLLEAYRYLPLYPEVTATLEGVAARGRRLAILSNGTPGMLADMTACNRIAGLFEALISVEEAGVYKPDARVYALVCTRLGVAARDVLFVSANGWDVAGAARFGFTTVWVNRAGQPIERLPHGPSHVVRELSQLGGFA